MSFWKCGFCTMQGKIWMINVTQNNDPHGQTWYVCNIFSCGTCQSIVSIHKA